MGVYEDGGLGSDPFEYGPQDAGSQRPWDYDKADAEHAHIASREEARKRREQLARFQGVPLPSDVESLRVVSGPNAQVA